MNQDKKNFLGSAHLKYLIKHRCLKKRFIHGRSLGVTWYVVDLIKAHRLFEKVSIPISPKSRGKSEPRERDADHGGKTPSPKSMAG